MAAKKTPPRKKSAPKKKRAAVKSAPSPSAATRKKSAPPARPAAGPSQLPGALASPDELREKLGALVEAWQTAGQTPTPANVDRLASLSSDLENGARTVREQAEALAEATRTSALALKRIQVGVGLTAPPSPVAGQPAVVAVVVPADEEPRAVALAGESFDVEGESTSFDVEAAPTAQKPDMALEAFFEQVSNSVLKAQRRLDLASIAYSQDLTNSPIPPSLFSIPKVTAEIKLGLSVADNSNVLVTIFGHPENTTNFSESTVSFDVVATPPPPGGAGVYTAPIPSFLVVGDERNSVAAEIAGINDLIRPKTGDDLSGPPASWLPLSVIIRAGADALPAASRTDYLFIKRGASPDRPVFLVRFNQGKAREGKISNVTDADLRLALFDLVARIREWESLVTLSAKA